MTSRSYVACWHSLSGTIRGSDDNVGNASGFCVLGERVVGVFAIGVFGDYVPGVEEAGDEA
jgi:hypothetical protein